MYGSGISQLVRFRAGVDIHIDAGERLRLGTHAHRTILQT